MEDGGYGYEVRANEWIMIMKRREIGRRGRGKGKIFDG